MTWNFVCRYTSKGSVVYAIVLKYPESNKVDLYSINEFVNDKSKVTMLGHKGPIAVS